MRLLGLAIDGRGLGHLSRVRLLARLIRELRPDTELRLATESPAAWTLADEGVPVLKLPEALHPAGSLLHARSRGSLLREILPFQLGGSSPDIVLIDHLVERSLFEFFRGQGCRIWVVLRRMRPEVMRALFREPAASLVDAWLVPHAAAELPVMDLPRAWRPRCHHLGPLVRPLDEARAEDLRQTCPHPRILVSLGGGGAAEAPALARVGLEALERLRQTIPRLSARLVCGPLFPEPLPPAAPGVEVVAHEPDLAEWMTAADAVLTQAGYNSVEELLASGTPGVLLPLSSPGRDDQELRAREVQARGRALVSPAEPAALAAALESVLTGRGPARRPPSRTGSPRAREVLQSLLDARNPQRAGRSDPP
jgi:predicted glycosyltransferase